MNVLSLFDGMSCGRIALDKANIKVNKYYAAEIDKYAVQVSKANYPETIHLGDVTKWREWDVDWANIDLLIGGSPCQGFSFAGKQLAFDDPRSMLFFVYVDILNHIKSLNPNVKFMLENVKMKKEFMAVITERLGVEPVFINSALVSAQNRQRWYWANWNIPQPEDKGIMLKDILVSGGTGFIKSHSEYKERNEKSQCIDANYHKGADNHGQRTLIRPCELKPFNENSLCHHAADATDIKGHGYNKRVYAESGKGPSLAAASGGNLEPKVLLNPAAIVGRKLDENGKRNDELDQKPVQCLEVQSHGKSRCLSTVSKDTVVSPLSPGRYPNGTHYRKLTPIECERLQTAPDNYTNHVSNTQRYKMLGNGWTVDVIAHIFEHMAEEKQEVQLSMFG